MARHGPPRRSLSLRALPTGSTQRPDSSAISSAPSGSSLSKQQGGWMEGIWIWMVYGWMVNMELVIYEKDLILKRGKATLGLLVY